MGRTIALILISCAALLGVGYLLLGSEELPPGEDAATPEPARPAPPVAHPVIARTPEADASQALDAKASDPAGGAERKPPPNLEPRFSEAEVRGAVAAALKEAGARGAGISSVDCTEFPCIVYVENVSRYDSKKIAQAPSLATYRQESGFTACFPTARSDGTGAGACGFAYEPRIDSPQVRDAALKRLQYRVEQQAEQRVFLHGEVQVGSSPRRDGRQVSSLAATRCRLSLDA